MLQRKISGYKSRTPIALRSTDQAKSYSSAYRCFSNLYVDESKIPIIKLKVSGAILSQKSIQANHNDGGCRISCAKTLNNFQLNSTLSIEWKNTRQRILECKEINKQNWSINKMVCKDSNRIFEMEENH